LSVMEALQSFVLLPSSHTATACCVTPNKAPISAWVRLAARCLPLSAWLPCPNNYRR
jgi:hypothetical protein